MRAWPAPREASPASHSFSHRRGIPSFPAASPPSPHAPPPAATAAAALLLPLPLPRLPPPPQCLMERGGYTYLDVRPSPELDAVGKVKGSVNVPIMNGTFKYNPELRKKELIKEDNPDFVRRVGGCVLGAGWG